MPSKASMIHGQKALVTKCTSTQGNQRGKRPLRIILAGSELLSFPSWLPLLFSLLPLPPHGCEYSQIPLALLGWLVCFDHVEKPHRGLTDGVVWLRETKHKASTRQRRCDSNNSNRKRHQININLSTRWCLFHFIIRGNAVFRLKVYGERNSRQTSRAKEKARLSTPIGIICHFHQHFEASPVETNLHRLLQSKSWQNRASISLYIRKKWFHLTSGSISVCFTGDTLQDKLF